MAINKTVHTQYEIGFATPHLNPNPEYYDHGYADTYEITVDNPFDSVDTFVYRNNGNRGFGDPYGNIGAYIDGQNVRFSDNGGQIAVVRANFQDTYEDGFPLGRPLGPYRLILSNINGDGILYPTNSGVAGRKRNLYTTINQDKLYACLPVMPKGTYNATLYWGDGFVNKTEIYNALTIVHRNRYDKTIATRNKMPSWLNRGNISDNYLPSQNYVKNESNFAILTESFAEVLDYTVSNVYTVVTTKAKRGDTSIAVETTLSFPSSGYIRIGNQRLYYGSKTDTSFDDIETPIEYIIRTNTRVEPDKADFSAVYNYFDRLHLDLNKPKWQMRDEDWMKAFRTIKFGEKQNVPVILQYLYHLLASSITPITCTVASSGEVLVPNVDEPQFVDAYRNKFIVLERKTGPDTFEYRWFKLDRVSAGIAYLSKYGCSYFMGTFFGENEDWLNEEVVARVLPFWIEKDFDAHFKIVLDNAVLPINPGFIDVDYIDYNIYLGADDLGRGTNLLKFLVSGVKGEFTTRDWGHDDEWPRSLIQDFRSPALVIEPSRTFEE